MMFDTDNMAIQLPTDKTRRKRLKVISACSECRRKKTKCNGEKPCAGCIKTNIECKYSTTPKSKAANNHHNLMNSSTASNANSTNSIHHKSNTASIAMNNHPNNTSIITVIKSNNNNNNNNTGGTNHVSTSNTTTTATTINSNHSRTNNLNTVSHHQNNTSNSNRIEAKSAATIHAIENRLSVIEDILQVLLLNSTGRRGEQSEPGNSAFHQRNMHPHSGPYCGEMYSPSYENKRPEKRRYSEVVEDDRHYQYYQQNNASGYQYPTPQYQYHPQSYPNRPVEPIAESVRDSQPMTTFISHNVNDPVHVRLPPLNYRNSSQPPLSESCSTSTASSTCSTTSSPKINTIQTLLNDDDKIINEYPSPTRHHEEYGKYRPSAFYRPTAGTDHA
ncbi:hypothetical protein BDB01DRAFT_792241 [Pilobolus umbonatus]|nr:hypothetical protein BDB01DRAFT_792241 [Pilobolus umbonatus]